MASQVTNYKCPACGGPLHYVGASDKLECDYCGSSYSVTEIEAQTQTANAAAEQWAVSGGSDWGAEGMKTYSCPSCGAELICDGSTAATCCPYCGNQSVIPGQFSGSLKPEFVISFKTDKDQAKAALKEHYKGKKLLPKSFVSGNHIQELQGVYVPFWLFDCEAEGEVRYEASISSTRTAGDKEITTTKYYDVVRGGSLAFSKVPVDASSRMPHDHMDSLEPYDYGQLKPFSMAYMPGFLADKYDLEAEVCSQRMEQRCEKAFLSEAQKTVTGYDNVEELSKSVKVKKGAAHYALLPVWLLATKWNGKDFLFAMNGQSGKLVGDLPVDKGKYWTWLLGIAAVLIAILQVLNNFVMKKPLTGAGMVLVCILLPLLIALIAASSMKGKMKTVHGGGKATKYISGQGFRLLRKEDNYLRTTTETENK